MCLKLRFLSLILIVGFARSETDEYIMESHQQCSAKNNLFSCAKYRALSYLSTLGEHYGFTGNTSSLVKFVKLERYQPGGEVFPTARQFSSDSEFTKFFKFVKRQVNYYLGTQGVQFSLPEEAQIIENDVSNEVEEGRGKKKKAAMVLMPLIILFKLFKIKIMVAIVLASLIFIKKAILLGALVLPSIIEKIKHCAKQQSYHHTPYHFDEHEHEDLGGYYGGGYSKDYERAYNAYLKTKLQ